MTGRQPPHSIALNNASAQTQAQRKWRRQTKQVLAGGMAPHKARKQKNEKTPAARSPAPGPASLGVNDPKKGSKSLFLM